LSKSKLTFAEDVCKGCLLCVEACPKHILSLNLAYVNDKGYNPVKCDDPEQCIACAMCAVICPDSVIRVEREDL
jgi:2-oxoglutarate ferredoxin oxidoreductase subunit delta